MKKKSALGEFIDSYTDDKGENPILASISLLTFAKRIPIQVIKAIFLSVGVYLLFNALLYIAAVENWLLGVSLIGGLILMAILCFTATLKFVSGAFLEEVSDLFMGIISPIDTSYDLWRAQSDEDLSRKGFMVKVVREVILPKFLGSLGRLLFRKKLDAGAQNVLDEVESSEIDDQDDSFLDRIIDKFQEGVNNSKGVLSKPFFLTLKVAVWVFGIMICIHLAINWEKFVS